VAIAYHPELEYYPHREFVEATLADQCYHRPSGYRTYLWTQNEVWGDDVRREPTELIDLGDRLVLLADMPMRAQARTRQPPQLRDAWGSRSPLPSSGTESVGSFS
jgi:hypothetical protein